MNGSVQEKSTVFRPLSWSFLQQELLVLCWGVMDIALLVPLALALMPFARYWPPAQLFGWLLLLMLFALNLTRLMSALHISPGRQQGITAVLLTLTIFLSLQAILHSGRGLFDFRWIGEFFNSVTTSRDTRWGRDVALFLLIVIAWTRGIQLAGREFEVDRAGLRLRLGGLIFAPLIIWISHNRLLWNPMPYFLLFFLAGLTVIALIRAADLEKERSGRLVSLTPRWLLGIFGAALLTVLTAAVVTTMITGQGSQLLLRWLAPLTLSVQFTISVAVSTLFFVVLPIMTGLETVLLSGFLSGLFNWLALRFMLLSKIISKLNRDSRLVTEYTPPEQTGGLAEAESILEMLRQVEITPNRLFALLALLLGVAIILMVSLIIGRIIQPADAAARLGTDLERPSPSRDRENLAQRVLRRLGWFDGWRTAASIRRIYRNMLAAAAVQRLSAAGHGNAV
jgi:hypothetical protein